MIKLKKMTIKNKLIMIIIKMNKSTSIFLINNNPKFFNYL
jgi:hypothetical protein